MKKDYWFTYKQACRILVAAHLLLLFCSNILMAQHAMKNENDTTITSFRLHTDLLYASDKKLHQDYYIIAPHKSSVKVQVKCYWYKSVTDSLLLYKNTISAQTVEQGLNRVKVNLDHNGSSNYMLPSFALALKRSGIVPPGLYKLQLILYHDNEEDSFSFMHDIDSALSMESNIRTGLNNLLMPVKYNFFGQPTKIPSSLDKVSTVFNRSKHKLAKYCKKNGLIADQYLKNEKNIIDLYSDEWFMGRYEMNSNASVSNEIEAEQKAMEHNVGDLTKNGLGDFKSLVTQFRELKEESKAHDEIQGQIAISSNFSTAQEPNSDQDNNYYEATANISLPLFNIPFNISGYYTSQDKHREAKASYVHLNYDVDKAKEQLLKLITAYNKRYAQTLSQGGSYEMIYGQYLQQLEQQQMEAMATLGKELGVTDLNASHLNEAFINDHAKQMALSAKDKALDTLMDIGNRQRQNLKDSLSNVVSENNILKDAETTIEKAKDIEQKSVAAYAKAMEKYHQIMELQRKMEKYKALLGQYKNTIFYDSLMAYSKLGSVKDVSNMSYKDMAKKASSLLPEGKMKNVITGLTSFDAGMFSKYVSDYTISNQMLKGLDIGYDVGFATIGGSYGKTQYIDHNGAVEDYKMYSMRASFKPFLHQQFGLIYMGYSPSAKLFESAHFLKDADLSVPSFKKPVQIVSLTYSGDLGKYLSLAGEYAISNQSSRSANAAEAIPFNERSSYNVKAMGSIPSTFIQLEAGYEHAGNAFENNTLPVIMAGTDKIALQAKGDFFRSFLTMGVAYNYLVQNSFYSKGKNSRWGFDIATHSKRYPSVSLSYKPFSTFRSVNDTMSIAQKPIVGEVWTGKLSYQIKRMGKAVRLMLMYNRNRSIMDSMNYKSSLIQFSTTFTRKTTMLSLIMGSSDISTDYFTTAYPIFNKSQFVNIAASGNVLKNVMLSGGGDMAVSKIGLSKYGLFTGINYSFTKMPLMLRGNFRYTNFRLEEGSSWRPLYFGSIELAWKFKMKMWD